MREVGRKIEIFITFQLITHTQHTAKRMIAVKILNFYNTYMNNIITLYYVIGSTTSEIHKNNDESDDALDLMELGFGIMDSWYHDDNESDIEKGRVQAPYFIVDLPHKRLIRMNAEEQ